MKIDYKGQNSLLICRESIFSFIMTIIFIFLMGSFTSCVDDSSRAGRPIIRQFGTTEEGDPLTHEQYKANLIEFILTKQDVDEIWKKGIFDLEDIVLQDWAENRRMVYDA